MRRNTFPGFRSAFVHALLVLLALLVLPSTATHYRFGTVSYKIISTDGQVEFRIQLAYRRSFRSSWLSGEIGDVVDSSGSWVLDDGTSKYNPQLTITAFSADKDWVFLEGSYQHTYADTTRTYYPEFRSCCRISSLINNADANYISRTMVTFPSTRTNESPISSGLPIVHVQQDSKGQFTIPVSDTDNDEISCVEADPINTLGRSQTNAYPGWLTVDTAGIVRYDTTVGAAVGLYNYAVQFSDAHSNIHIDFIIEVTERENFCACAEAANTLCGSSDDCSACAGAASCDVNLAPVFENPSPAAGSTLTVSQGQTLTATFRATDPNAVDVVTIKMASAPAGTTLSESVVNGSTSMVQVVWQAPLTTVEGYATHIICVWAEDNHNMQSTQYCVNILVDPVTEVPQPPDPPHLLATTGQSLKVGWNAPNVTDVRALDGYYLYVDGHRVSWSAGEAMFLIGSTMEHTESYLKPGTGYTFFLELCNTLGCSEPSTEAQFSTISAPFNPPTVPQLVSRTERSITVYWDSIYIPAGRELVAYRLTVDDKDTYLTSPGTTSKLTDGFVPGSNHTFRVAACEPAQCGRESETAEFNTLDGFASLCEEPCPPSTVRESLTSHWSFDEGSGTIVSNSIAGAPDVLLDATVEWRAGEHGKAINLNGANSAYANHSHGNSTLDMEGEYTVCLWRRLDAGMNPAASAALLTKGGRATSAAATPLHVVENFPNEVQMIIADGSTKLQGASVTIAPGYELDTWHHVCFVRDRGGYPTSNPCTTENVVYTGTTLAGPFQTESADACQELCDSGAHGACVGFSWSKTSSRRSAASYGCTLFSSLGAESMEIGAVSGPPKCNATVIGYVDGTRQISVLDPTADNVTNSDPLYMGKAVWADEQNLKGRLDEVLIYSTALTANQVLSVYEACLPASTAALECPQCPLDIRESWPLMENFQAGGAGPIECRDCCRSTCDELCFNGGTNPANCVGATAREAYIRCIGEGYIHTNCENNEEFIPLKTVLSNQSWVDVVVLSDTGTTVDVDAGASQFNSLFNSCPVVQYTRNKEVVAVYVRRSLIPSTFDAYSVFTETFVSTDNTLHSDFNLHDSLYDAQAEMNAWQYCNYDVTGVGFPRDCGKNGLIENRWMSMPSSVQPPGVTNGTKLSIYSGSVCPVTQDSGINNAGCYFGGTARRCENDCVLPGMEEASNGKCDTWTGKCTFPADCESGFNPVGATCIDVDECVSGNYGEVFCATRNAYCTNSIGSYSCSCLSGYEGNATLGVCTDIDECAASTVCSTDSVCANTVGGFTCQCPDGYTGDGLVNGTGCTDINECQLGLHTCANAAICTNGAGNYSCSCRSGFSGNGYDGALVSGGTNCTDVDECTTTNPDLKHACDVNAQCDNEVGHYDCACNSGFTGDGTASDPCIDIDECLLDSTNNCTTNSGCTNLPGNYSCLCNAGFSGDPFSTCTRCTSEGTGNSVLFDGYDDMAVLSVDPTGSLELSGSTGFTAQVWFNRDGASTFSSTFDFDQAFYNFTNGRSEALYGGNRTIEPIFAYTFNESSYDLNQGYSLILGIQGNALAAGITATINTTGVLHRVAILGEAAIVDGRWHRATVQFSSSSSELMLMLDTVTVATVTFAAGSSSALLQPSPTLILGGDSLSSGVFKGRVRDARFWSSAIDAYSISNTDCTSGSPLIQFHWEEAVYDDGCPIGDYCMTWMSPQTCQTNTAILCGIVTDSNTISSQGTLPDATWTLTGAMAADDWPLMLYDGQGYWNKLEYHADRGPCSGSASCSMAINHNLDIPTPIFQYMTGLKQEHVGTDCSGSAVARVLLNSYQCSRYNTSSSTWVEAYGSSYTAYDTWNCSDAFIGQGNAQGSFQKITQTAVVTCCQCVCPELLIGSQDDYVYVRN